MDDTAYTLDIGTHLSKQAVDARARHLVPKPGNQFDLDLATVHVAIEVEQMNLDEGL